MNDLEKGIVCFMNELHRNCIYRYEEYQLLHGLRYRKDMQEEKKALIREKYKGKCFKAAYELKTYYMENDLLSNTIVLKMRPKSPEIQGLNSIKIHSELDGIDYTYMHHTIEIFKENGRYKVFDILHRDKTVWLESYLDEVCKTNNCPREQLRYDMGYLAPSHVFAENMKELSDLMRYLDKTYKLGKPRLNLMNIANTEEEVLLLSDDLVMDFDMFGKKFGVSEREVFRAYQSIYDKMMGVRFNILHMLCLGHIMRDPIMKFSMAESLFDDEKMCKLIEGRQVLDTMVGDKNELLQIN